MLISELLKEIGEINNCVIINEKPFDNLARITSVSEGKKCVFLADKSYLSEVANDITMVITKQEFESFFRERNVGLCICEKPKRLYNKLLNYIAEQHQEYVPTIIGDGCQISEKAYIAPYNVVIENNVIVEEYACIYEGSLIKEGTIIHAGAKISTQDYNYYEGSAEEYIHLKHVGRTILDKCVDVGYNTIIGRALYDYSQTFIGEGCKIGSGVLIGHDCYIDYGSKIYANSTLGGNVKVGHNSNIYMGVTIKNAISIGNNSNVEMGSVVIRSVKDEQNVFGNPARVVLSPKA